MTEHEFREAMYNGLGRAILYARDNDVSQFRNAILDACLHCYAVDPQCEGTRANYMFELVNLTPGRELYHAEVLRSLKYCGDDWDAVQRFRFVSFMAMDGDDRARQAMYTNFRPGPRMVESSGVDFLAVDGVDGFLFAAGKVGALLAASPEDVDQGYLISVAVDALGEEEVASALAERGRHDADVERYRLAAEASRVRESESRNPVAGLSYAQIKPLLPSLKPYRVSLWGRRASSADLEMAAHDLIYAESLEERLALVRIFQRAKFPLDPAWLVRYSESEELQRAALVALENVSDPSVRDLAFRMMREQLTNRDLAIHILFPNYQQGDHEIALRWFQEEEDRDRRHKLGLGLRNLWEAVPDAESELQMLKALYEKGPCSACREYMLSRLIELGGLTEAMRHECRYDANEDIRELVSKE